MWGSAKIVKTENKYNQSTETQDFTWKPQKGKNHGSSQTPRKITNNKRNVQVRISRQRPWVFLCLADVFGTRPTSLPTTPSSACLIRFQLCGSSLERSPFLLLTLRASGISSRCGWPSVYLLLPSVYLLHLWIFLYLGFYESSKIWCAYKLTFVIHLELVEEGDCV